MHKLLIQEPPLQVLPSLAEEIGLNEAIVLQQTHWLLHASRYAVTRTAPDSNNIERTWVRMPQADWVAKLSFWSRSTIKRTLRSLKEQDLILTRKLTKDDGDTAVWYSVQYESLPGDDTPEPKTVEPEPEPSAPVPDDAPTASAPTREAFREAYDGTWEPPDDVSSADAVCAHPAVRMMFDPMWSGVFQSKLNPHQHTHQYQLGKVALNVTDFDAWYSILEYWAENDNDPTSVGKMRDRYDRIEHGELPRYKSSGLPELGDRTHADKNRDGIERNDADEITFVGHPEHLDVGDVLVTDAAKSLAERFDDITANDFQGLEKSSAARYDDGPTSFRTVTWRPRDASPYAAATTDAPA